LYYASVKMIRARDGSMPGRKSHILQLTVTPDCRRDVFGWREIYETHCWL